MRLVSALVRPHELAALAVELGEVGVQGMTVFEVRVAAGRSEVHRGRVAPVDDAVVRLDCAVEDGETETVVRVLVAATGLGPVWSTPLDQLVRVRTGERGADAL